MNLIKDQLEKFPDMEENMNKILRNMKQLNLGELRDEIKQLNLALAQRVDNATFEKTTNDIF